MASLVVKGGRAASSTAPTEIISRQCGSARRAFSSSAVACGRQRIPPESPLFINVPNPPQDQSIEARRHLGPVKGHLPTPREVFKHRDSYLKPTEEYLAKATPLPTSARSQKPATSEYQQWKRDMAANRRENMRVGVKALWDRKQVTDTKRARRSAQKLAANKKAAMAPEPEDERLTNATVPTETLKTAVERDPERFERQLTSAARSQALADSRSERRRDAIQVLYMNARSFIVDEDELQKEVDRLFSNSYWQEQGKSSSGKAIKNAWDMYGKPRSLSQMLQDYAGGTNALIQSETKDSTKTRKRQMRLAEELTGGKMDNLTSDFDDITGTGGTGVTTSRDIFRSLTSDRGTGSGQNSGRSP